MFQADHVTRMTSGIEPSHGNLFGLLNIVVLSLLIVTGSCDLISHQTNIVENGNLSKDRHHRQVSLLEDELCLANYDVSEGSIIRTHDSQRLGAKYLNETDLGPGIKSRDDCLRLCCRTERCNVAVFEEKKNGSCYLFDCGPVEDLRCKFTSQPYYMSAILRKREIAFPNLNQHETELSQLRVLDRVENNGGNLVLNNNNNGNIIGYSSNEPNTNKQLQDMESETGRTTLSPQTTTTTVPPHAPPQQQLLQPQPILVENSNLQPQQQQQQQQQPFPQQMSSPILQQQPQPLTQRRSPCGRNQFECKSTGECIAIYNVCNGIPQCADGSDESSELHCPAAGSSYLSPGSGIPGDGGNANHNGFVPSHSHNDHERPSQQEEYRLTPPQQQPMSSNAVPNKNNGKDQIISPQPQMQVQPQSPLNIFTHKDGGIMDEHENYGSQLQQQRHSSSYWKPSTFIDYNAGDPASSSNSNGNGNSYGMNVVPLANSGLYGSNVNNNNNYGNGPPSSYAYPQYPLQGIPGSSQSQPLPAQQQFGQYANGNPLNFNSLQALQTPQQQQQQQFQQAQYYNNINAANPGYNNNLNNGLNNPNSPNFMTNSSPNRLLPPNNRPPIPGANGGPPQSSVNQQSSLAIPNSGLVNKMQNLPRTTNMSTGADGSGKQQQEAVIVPAPSTNSVNYNEISKLELPQSLRKLAPQLQSFAFDSEKDDLTDHSAGPGAVLAFIMGLGMSIIMVIIVGCRLRRIGTRRRGKNRLDPDYLVDGMYL